MHDEIIIYQDDQPQPQPRRRWRGILKWLLVLVVMVAIAAALFLLVNLFRVTGNPFSFGALKGESSGRVNIMLLGVGDPGHEAEKLSDTNILLSVDTKNKQVAMIGIPRDLRVRIPNYGFSKINNAHAQAGVPGTKQVYENSFGVPVHYYVKANFSGLKQVVDAVGGVEVNNEYLLSDPAYPCDNNQYRSCGFRLAPGKHHLNGTQALKYVRCRKGTCGDDFGRAERQQEVMQSIRRKATSAGTLANPVALGKLVSAAGQNIDTDLSVNNMMRLNELTRQAGDDRIYRIVLSLQPDGYLVSSGNSSDLLPRGGSFAAIQNFVRGVFTLGPVWTEHPTVMIENGTTTAGIGARFESKLEAGGYPLTVTAVTNALQRDYQTSQIIDYTGGKRPHTTAYMKSLLGVEVSQPQTPVKTPPADVVVILGADYAAKTSSAASTQSDR